MVLQIAALAMTGLIALDLLFLAHTLRTPDTTPVPPPPRAVESAPPVDVDKAVREAEPLLGKASPSPGKASPVPPPVAPVVVAPTPQPAVPSRPALLLTGTVLGPRPTAVVAVSGKVRVMRLGDPLGDRAGAWRIARIEDDRVVIRAGAAQHILLLGFQEDETPEIAAVPVSTPAPPPAPTAAAPAASPPPPSPRGVVPRQQRDQALRDKKEYERFALLPDEGGVGVRITYLRDDAFFARLGLRQDDVLLKVNGQVVDQEHSDEVYRTLMHEDRFVIHARRDGKDLTLDVEVR